MKKLMITLLLAFGLMSLSFTVFPQEFYLDKIHETGLTTFTNIFVSGQEILAFTAGEGLYYNGSQWGGVSIPNSDQWGQVHGFTKTGGGIFASFSTTYKSYLWDDNGKAWDFYSSPIQSPKSTFVFSENKIYVCTGLRTVGDNSALYLWDGSNSFTELSVNSGVAFRGCFAVNENNVLIIGYNMANDNVSINKLFRYNGSSIQEIVSFDLDKGEAVEIHSVDLETFFIPTDKGYLYRWNNTTSQLDKVYTLDGCENMNVVVKDNDNVFIYSNQGVKHLKVSTGETTDLMVTYPGYEGEYPVTNVSDGFFEKETGRLFLSCRNGGKMYEIKPDSTNSVDGINDISSEVKLYPNPAVNNIYLQLPNSLVNSVKIYNVIGSQVMDFVISNDTENLDISSLPTGMYMLKVETSDGRGVKKFIKK